MATASVGGYRGAGGRSDWWAVGQASGQSGTQSGGRASGWAARLRLDKLPVAR